MRTFVLGLAILALLAGCGGSEEDEIRETVRTVADRANSGDGEKVCDLLVDAALEDAESDGMSCVEAIEKSEPVEGKLTVSDIRIDGNRATARIQVAGHEAVKWRFVRSDGTWKVSDTEA